MQPPKLNISGMPDRLREVIAKTGLSQPKFAESTGIDLGRLKDVLRGQMKPPMDLIQKVVEHCDVDAMWLVSGQRLDLGEMSDTEKVMIANLRLLSASEKAVMIRAVAALATASQKRK
jgi:transcriptional regulator with XRE-family HTH domain